jgi:D-3-phosphoglycerate dehydrogenase / 2-oxoglutarate reductase
MTESAARTVVITYCDHGTIAPEQQVLAGHDIELRLADCKTPRDVVEQARDADVLINQYAPITGEVLDGLPRCRLVVRYGVGVDNVDVPAATSRGVWVANVPGYGRAEVADHAVALALTLLRGVAVLDRSVRAGRWDYRVAQPLRRLGTLTFGVSAAARSAPRPPGAPPGSACAWWTPTSSPTVRAAAPRSSESRSPSCSPRPTSCPSTPP